MPVNSTFNDSLHRCDLGDKLEKLAILESFSKIFRSLFMRLKLVCLYPINKANLAVELKIALDSLPNGYMIVVVIR